MEFFVGSPFTTPVGQLIENATDASLPTENWSMNMEICDLINSSEDGPKNAIRAIRKRLQQNAGKNYTIVLYTLTVLETCVKNCGRRFHILACNKEFLQELVKLIGPKNDPPTAVQEKVLSLIQSWADAFQHQGELAGVVQIYTDLKQRGIEFPMTDLDTMAPIHTPHRSVHTKDMSSNAFLIPPSTLFPKNGSNLPQVISSSSFQNETQNSLSTITPSPDQIAKLQSELDIVQSHMTIFNEMVCELTPGKEHPNDMQMLKELSETCKSMQQRLVQLIGKLSNDKITAELLRINDELNNLLLRYSRFEKDRKHPNSMLGTPKKEDLLTTTTALQDLHLSDTYPGNNGVVEKSRSSEKDKEDSEFDMFAQSRNITYESSKKEGSTYKDNLEPDQMTGSLASVAQARSQPGLLGSEKDFEEMAAWLNEKSTDPNEKEALERTGETLTSGEFEHFLAERAVVTEALPNVESLVPSSTTASHPQARQLNTESDLESSLFAL